MKRSNPQACGERCENDADSIVKLALHGEQEGS